MVNAKEDNGYGVVGKGSAESEIIYTIVCRSLQTMVFQADRLDLVPLGNCEAGKASAMEELREGERQGAKEGAV